MPLGYGYGNARLRARRSRLLTEANYTDLLRKSSIEEVITALTDTPYKDDVEMALLRAEGVRCVFEALRTNLTRTLRRVREFYEGEPRALVDLLLRRWDRHNLLAILRGQSHEVAPELVLSTLVTVGQLSEVSLRELARQPGLRAAIDLMSTWRLPYAGALRGAGPDLDQLELALNRFHYASIRGALAGRERNRAIARDSVQAEVDVINIRAALRLARLPEALHLVQRRYNATDVRPLFIEPGGYVSTARLAALVAERAGLEGMVRGLGDTRYGPALEAGWRRYERGNGNGDLATLERELERWQAEFAAAMFTRNSLSIAVPIGYLGCKEVEVANLRLIAQAVNLDMKRDQVQRDLIIV